MFEKFMILSEVLIQSRCPKCSSLELGFIPDRNDNFYQIHCENCQHSWWVFLDDDYQVQPCEKPDDE